MDPENLLAAQRRQSTRFIETEPFPDAAPNLAVAQPHLAGGEHYLKVYAIGQELFGVRKQFLPDSPKQAAGVPCSISKQVRKLVLQCGQIFQLRLYNVDLVGDATDPQIVDVNYFPSYEEVPAAVEPLVGYIEGMATRLQ